MQKAVEARDLQPASDAAGNRRRLIVCAAAQNEESEKARKYALDAFATPSSLVDTTHIANNVLGLGAMHDGSTILRRWGPTLALAKALLDKRQQ